ncbi:beta-propeller fold lactonase family protein [Candidatus Hydrogenedentota bacterium]
MRKNPGVTAYLLLTVSVLFLGKTSEASEDYLSPLNIVADTESERLYIGEYTGKQVVEIDAAQEKVIRTWKLKDNPTGLALSSDASFLYVTGGRRDQVHVVNLVKGKLVSRIDVGRNPTAPVLSPDGKILYICNRFDNNVSVIDIEEEDEVARIPVSREPIAAAVTSDGKFLFVANLLHAGAADQDVVAAVVSVIDTDARRVAAIVELPNGSSGLRGICLSPDGDYAYVTHTLGRFHLPTTQLQRGWMNTNALTIIDANRKTLVNTVLLDDLDRGAANPWGVTCTPDAKSLLVSHAGTDEVSIIDRMALHKELSIRAGDGDIPNELTFLGNMRRRIKLEGIGPRGIIVLDDKAFMTEYFTDSLGIVDLNTETGHPARSVQLESARTMSPARRGEMLFHSAIYCFQQWQSCSSCHPDARTDSLNWDLLNDGLGNPRNVKSLLLSHETPPVMITGIRPDAETAVRAGLKYIQFASVSEEDAKAIDEYLKSLKPEASPYLAKGKLTKSAKRGGRIFEESGCADCHPAPLHTDLNKYDVDTGRKGEEAIKLDTTTLVEVWRTAPYLNDGCAATIREVLTKYNPDDRHGKTSHLRDDEIENLVDYVLSQ